MYDELMKHNMIDLIINVYLDRSLPFRFKQYASMAIVHFALNKNSLEILVQKNVMELFNVFSE